MIALRVVHSPGDLWRTSLSAPQRIHWTRTHSKQLGDKFSRHRCNCMSPSSSSWSSLQTKWKPGSISFLSRFFDWSFRMLFLKRVCTRLALRLNFWLNVFIFETRALAYAVVLPWTDFLRVPFILQLSNVSTIMPLFYKPKTACRIENTLSFNAGYSSFCRLHFLNFANSLFRYAFTRWELVEAGNYFFQFF